MYVASASTTVKFHSYPEGDLIYNYQPGTKVDGPIRSISWSKDGNWLALVPKSGHGEIITLKDQLRLIHTITDVQEPSCSAFQHTTKKSLAFGTKNGEVLLYDVKAKKIRKTYTRTSSLVSHIEFTAKDSHLVAASLNGEVTLYSNLTNKVSAVFKIPRSESISCLRTNPSKRNFIIGGSNEGVVVVWNIDSNKPKFFIESHKAPVTGVAFSPVNSDLVISTGADRQFFCYDIISGKCIACASVENSMTAVDFSPDGTHFIMASQNGKMHLYDSRKIQQPALTYEAHKSTIKFVAFQKLQLSTSSSNLSEDKDTVVLDNADDSFNDDSFPLYAQVYSQDKVNQDNNCTASSAADSFLAAVAAMNRTTDSPKMPNSPGITNEVKKWLDSKNNTEFENSLIHPKKTIHDRIGLSHSRQLSSTPIEMLSGTKSMIGSPGVAIGPQVSPIVGNGDSPMSRPVPQLSDLKEVIKDIVKEEIAVVKDEISEKMEAIKADIKYQTTSSMNQMRRMILDLQMVVIKEFIKQENGINTLREDLASETPVTENYLLEENLKLKKQICLLEEQLAIKSDQ